MKSDKSPIVKIRPPTKCISIGNGKHIKGCSYRHKLYVNIRDYITTSDGQLNATKRGILLHPYEWKQLKKVVKEVDQELKLVYHLVLFKCMSLKVKIVKVFGIKWLEIDFV